MEGNIFKERGELIRGKTGRENTDRCGYKTKDPSTPYPVSTMTISRWFGMSKSWTNFRYFLLILPQSPIISPRASHHRDRFYTSVDFSSKTLCKIFKPPKSSSKEFHRSATHCMKCHLLFLFQIALLLASFNSPYFLNWKRPTQLILRHLCPSQVCRSLLCSPPSHLFFGLQSLDLPSLLFPHTFLSFPEIPLILFVAPPGVPPSLAVSFEMKGSEMLIV